MLTQNKIVLFILGLMYKSKVFAFSNFILKAISKAVAYLKASETATIEIFWEKS